ncbi:MAG: patatin-like phospholipase family protein [Candidatus Cloacimonetes bacterium]|nr:patatin-like phospholipase family protein [Candidatus Cloacimonadota bacterium]
MENKKEINLVLSGGSARGLAHIGILSVLEKHFHIKSIIGTSMGAIVGGLYAYGYTPEEMLGIPESFNIVKLISIFKPKFKTSGVIDGKGILEFFEEKTRDCNIEHCKIPFAAVAFDLRSKRSILFDKGSLAKALRASSSLPFIFQPFQYGKYLLVDGFIEHPLPIKFANYFFDKGLTVACSVLPPAPAKYEVFEFEQSKDDEEIPKVLDIFFQTNFYSQSATVLDAIFKTKPDIYISAYDEDLDFWDLKEAEKFFEVGKAAAEKVVSKYLADSEHFSQNKFMKRLHDNYEEFRKMVRRLSQ